MTRSIEVGSALRKLTSRLHLTINRNSVFPEEPWWRRGGKILFVWPMPTISI